MRLLLWFVTILAMKHFGLGPPSGFGVLVLTLVMFVCTAQDLREVFRD